MKIIINRIHVKTLTTDGILYIDGQRICDTTEATPKLLPEGTYKISIFKCTKNKRQIPIIRFDSRQYDNGIPSPLKCEHCASLANECERLRISEYGKLQYAIQNGIPHTEVLTFEKALDNEVQKEIQTSRCNSQAESYCPKLIHGNGVFNLTDGSILVGIYRLPGLVINSRPTFDRLYERIEKAISRGHSVELTIYNS